MKSIFLQFYNNVCTNIFYITIQTKLKIKK
nr:MAG TPA: hypothetical protein [Caudoviricetes sp.]DAU75974.1 MAG TPA: hypothetical protein [Bacteriophage sp.]